MGARGSAGEDSHAARCGDSSAVYAKPRSPRCRVGAGSLESARISACSIDRSIANEMIHPRLHRKPEAGRRWGVEGEGWMLCGLKHVARGQRN